MTDVLTEEQRSYNMSQIRGRDTKPEIKLRKFLWNNGLKGYRVHHDLTGKPDIVYTRQKVAVFIDGCFWHKCPECFKKPSTRTKWWMNKINGNVERDRQVNEELENKGWNVLRFWEHEVKKDIQSVYEEIREVLEG